MHFEIVPITEDGRLSAKDVVGNKKALASFQDKFNEYVNERGYELEQGTSRELTIDNTIKLIVINKKQNIIRKNMNVGIKFSPYKTK